MQPRRPPLLPGLSPAAQAPLSGARGVCQPLPWLERARSAGFRYRTRVCAHHASGNVCSRHGERWAPLREHRAPLEHVLSRGKVGSSFRPNRPPARSFGSWRREHRHDGGVVGVSSVLWPGARAARIVFTVVFLTDFK